MMQNCFVIIHLLVVAPSVAEEFATNRITDAHVSNDRFVDVLAERALETLVGKFDLDGMTLAKPGLRATPVGNVDLRAMLVAPLGPHSGSRASMIFPFASEASMKLDSTKNQRRIVQVRAASDPNVFELTKPLGLKWEPLEGKKGVKIGSIFPEGKAAQMEGMKEGAVLVTVNGQPCRGKPFGEIMEYIDQLSPEAVLRLELGEIAAGPGGQRGEDFGFGTNSMSSSQKELLIYGSLFGFFILFLLGYTLD